MFLTSPLIEQAISLIDPAEFQWAVESRMWFDCGAIELRWTDARNQRGFSTPLGAIPAQSGDSGCLHTTFSVVASHCKTVQSGSARLRVFQIQFVPLVEPRQVCRTTNSRALALWNKVTEHKLPSTLVFGVSQVGAIAKRHERHAYRFQLLYAKARGWTIALEETDQKSGASDKRPGNW